MNTNNIDNFKSGFISIIGKTNAGKSTLMNAIINANISITSKKKQTTRKNIKGILSDKKCQMIFIDTPGVHNRKNKLDDYMELSIKKSLEDIDVIIYLIDIKDNDIEEQINYINFLYTTSNNILIVINKIDLLQNDEFEEYKKNILKIFNNNINNKNYNIIFVSSLRKKHLDELYNSIYNILPIGPPYYDENEISDEPIKNIVAEIIRQQCLYKLDKEIPHGINVLIDKMKETQNKCQIDATIICEKASHKAIIIGKSGSMLKNIGIASRIYIEKFINKKVVLHLFVSIKENWRNEINQLINFGFKD